MAPRAAPWRRSEKEDRPSYGLILSRKKRRTVAKIIDLEEGQEGFISRDTSNIPKGVAVNADCARMTCFERIDVRAYQERKQ